MGKLLKRKRQRLRSETKKGEGSGGRGLKVCLGTERAEKAHTMHVCIHDSNSAHRRVDMKSSSHRGFPSPGDRPEKRKGPRVQAHTHMCTPNFEARHKHAILTHHCGVHVQNLLIPQRLP